MQSTAKANGDTPDKKQYFSTIKSISDRLHLPAEAVGRMYESALSDVSTGAKIRDYLPILASRRVRELLDADRFAKRGTTPFVEPGAKTSFVNPVALRLGTADYEHCDDEGHPFSEKTVSDRWLDLVEPMRAIRDNAKIEEVLIAFRNERDHTAFPVVDAQGKCTGVIRESDLKHYTYAAYGRELIRRKPVSAFVVPVEELSCDLGLEEVLFRLASCPENNGFVVTSEGRYAGFLSNEVFVRAYERHRQGAEQQILQLQRVDSLGTLAGGIAHELNNVLTPIIGNAELALDESVENPAVRDFLCRILSAASRASDIVRQILAYARPDESEKRHVKLADVVAEGLGLLRATLPSTIDFQTSLPAWSGGVFADPTQIHQVVLNLCKNAAQAIGHAHGVIEVTVEDCDADETTGTLHPSVAPGGYVRLGVRDTGCGMDPRVLQRIFEPFFTTKEVGEGTGLGLAVVLGIARSHRGSVTVESQPGCGSTFYVWFPRDEGSVERPQSVEPAAAKVHSARILLVDDEEIVVGVARALLLSLGHEVTATTSSLHALELFEAHPDGFDLVITDMNMPALTGEELILKLLAVRDDVPVVLCSGCANPLPADSAARQRVRACLAKPFTRSVLSNAVEKALAEHPVPINTSK